MGRKCIICQKDIKFQSYQHANHEYTVQVCPDCERRMAAERNKRGKTGKGRPAQS